MSSENRSPLAALRSIGPAIIVAAVVLGPGSIVTSSKVGAYFGYSGTLVLLVAGVLLIGMVRLAAHVGLAYENTPCQEIANRLGRKIAIALGIILFLIIACFQSSNNMAVSTGVIPLFGDEDTPGWAPGAAIFGINLLALVTLYALPKLYSRVENIMKLLVGLMILAFLLNAIAAAPLILKTLEGLTIMPVAHESLAKVKDFKDPYLSLQALIATTFSIAAAFYQAYLVRERGWTLQDGEKVRGDATTGILVLISISLLIMITSAGVFYGKPEAATLKGASDIAKQLEPLFQSLARPIFAIGFLAAAVSSFLVNAMIGGTILSDSLGRGSKMSDPWPRHFTSLALLVGMLAGLLSLTTKFDYLHLITIAQALTVIGVPALAAALIYLGTRPEVKGGEHRLSPRVLSISYIGAAVSVALALRTLNIVISKVAKLFISS